VELLELEANHVDVDSDPGMFTRLQLAEAHKNGRLQREKRKELAQVEETLAEASRRCRVILGDLLKTFWPLENPLLNPLLDNVSFLRLNLSCSISPPHSARCLWARIASTATSGSSPTHRMGMPFSLSKRSTKTNSFKNQMN
jgi:hypothetical protein